MKGVSIHIYLVSIYQYSSILNTSAMTVSEITFTCKLIALPPFTVIQNFESDSPLVEAVSFINDNHLIPKGYSISTPANSNSSVGENSLTPCKIYDISFSRPKIVEITAANDQKVGASSITLTSMGWFPSGKLIILLSS